MKGVDEMRESRIGIRRLWGACLMSLLAVASGAALAADLVTLKDGEAITSSDLSQYLERRVDIRASARSKWGVEQILREMAMSRALVMEGVRLGEPRQPGKESERFDDAYALSVFRKLIPPCDPPADAAAARKFFDENPQAFKVPPMAHLSRVMLPAAEKVDDMTAMDWLMAQAKLVASGAQTFEDVTKRADGIYRLEAQGDIGWAVLVDDNVILRTLASAKQGDMVGPVREGDFVYFFSIEGKRDSRQLAWDEVAVSAAARAANYCRKTATKKLEEELLAKYGVVMNPAAISSLFEKTGLR